MLSHYNLLYRSPQTTPRWHYSPDSGRRWSHSSWRSVLCGHRCWDQPGGSEAACWAIRDSWETSASLSYLLREPASDPAGVTWPILLVVLARTQHSFAKLDRSDATSKRSTVQSRRAVLGLKYLQEISQGRRTLFSIHILLLSRVCSTSRPHRLLPLRIKVPGSPVFSVGPHVQSSFVRRWFKGSAPAFSVLPCCLQTK